MSRKFNILIDNRQVEFSEKSKLSLSFEKDNILKKSSDTSEIIAHVTLPSTAANDDILLYSNQIASNIKFNSEPHTIVVESEGAVVASGLARLGSYNSNEATYHIAIAARELGD